MRFVVLPRDSAENVRQLFQSRFEDVERVRIQKVGGANVGDCLVRIELQVTFAEVVSVVVLMPADRPVAVGFDPLNPVVVVGGVLRKLELYF